MATTNLFTDPVFKDGAFTSHDAACAATRCRRRCARWTSASSSAPAPMCSGAAARGPRSTPARIRSRPIKRFRDAIDFLCEYARDQRYDLRFALEAKPNEPRGDIYFPTTAAYLGFIRTLAHPEMVGVNPEFAHEQMAGLSFVHAVAQVARGREALSHRSQRPEAGALRPGPAVRIRARSKPALLPRRLLEDEGYRRPRHFDAHAYRTEDKRACGTSPAAACRTYLILKAEVRAFAAHARHPGAARGDPRHRRRARRLRRAGAAAPRSKR
jgi:xylose isomerase